MCRVFATKGARRFDWCRLAPGRERCAGLDDALAWADCTIHAEHDAGDHVIVVGRVPTSTPATASHCLFGGRYRRLALRPERLSDNGQVAFDGTAVTIHRLGERRLRRGRGSTVRAVRAFARRRRDTAPAHRRGL